MPLAAANPARRLAPIVRPRPRLVVRPQPEAAPPVIVTPRAPRGHGRLTPASLEALRARCQGRTVFVLASGPSLTAADVAAVQATGAPMIVTNTTFRLAPEADALYFQDRKWFLAHQNELLGTFRGMAFSGQPVVGAPAVCNARHAGVVSHRNSGGGAIALAIAAGAARVVCLGLDCQPGPEGARHWHGAHPPGLGNAVSLPLWRERLAAVAADAQAKGVPVLNASRATALDCFPRVAVEAILAEPDLASGPVLRPEEITVYTTVLGATDPLYEPAVDWPGRMICYTDQPGLTSARWELLRLPPQAAPARMARRLKALSHVYTDTPWSLWLDACFTLQADPTRLARHGDWVRFRHPDNAHLAAEAAAILRAQKAPAEQIKAQLATYQAAGFTPAVQREQSACGVIMRQHTPATIALNEAWDAEIQGRSLRDQMSLDYCAWKLGQPLAAWPGHHRANPYFRFHHHRRPVNDT